MDRIFLVLTLLLVGGGFFIFSSASFGLLLKAEGAFADTARIQFFSVCIGLVALFLVAHIPLSFLRKYAWLFALAGALVMGAVLVPGWGIAHGGAVRWFSFGGISVQPGEFFKLGMVIALAAWLAYLRRASVERTFLMFVLFLALAGTLFLLQPDTDSFAILLVTACGMYAAAGLPRRHLLYLFCIAVIAGSALFFFRPYVADRLTIFIDPDRDPHGAGYQLKQSLIAVGNGGLVGKGFGRSTQKFSYLPEPTNDSVFAVFAEEFGFAGTVILVLLFTALALRGLVLSTRAPDMFGSLLTLGCTLLIIGAAFLNIASMLGLAPLSGLALPFISKGGSAILASLIAAGLVLNVSRASALGVSRVRERG